MRVATVTLHVTELFPNKSVPVSHVTVRRKRCALDECTELSAHELVALRWAGSVKCKKFLPVCGKKNLRSWLPTACVL